MKVRCMEVIEKRGIGGGRGGRGGGGEWGGIISAVRKSFRPQGQGANLFISLPEVTMKFYAVLCSDDERDQRP